MKIQQWTNKRKLTERWSYGCLGSSLQKIESRVLIDKGALTIVHVLSGWLSSSYQIRRAFLQHISWRVSVESVIYKRKSSCHFALRNGSIAVWKFVHPTEYGGDIGLKGFLTSQKLFQSTSEYHHYYEGGSWNMPEFLKSPYNSLSKVYRFIWSCRFVFLVLNLIFPPSRFSLLSSGRSLCYLPHFCSNSFKEKNKQPKIFFRAQCETVILRPVHTRELAPAARSRSKAPSSAPTIFSGKICCATKLLLPSFAPSYQTGLIWGSKLWKCALRERVSGASSLVCTGWGTYPGACFGSMF